MLNEQEARKLIEKAISFSKADEISVNLSGGRDGNIRYARNTVTTNGETYNLSISITSVFGKRSGTASTNELDAASLERTVKKSEEVARLAPENSEFMGFLEPQQYSTSATFSETSAKIDPSFRVDAVLASVEQCMKTNTVAAGFLEDSTSFVALGNNKGLFAYNKSTSGDFTITARTADEKGSGYAVQSFTDVSKLNTRVVTDRAIQKAIASREPGVMKPGKMTVILEPQAANDLIQLLVGAMDARNADEGRSFFGKRGEGNRIGTQLFNDKVTIISDPSNADNPTNIFAPDGRPQKKITWIENGFLRNLSYSRFWASKKNVDAIPPPSGYIMMGTDKTLEDLIRDTEKAVLVTRFWYIRAVDPQTLVYTGLTRDGTFYIENGEIKHAIKNLRFNESPAQMLSNLEVIGKPVRIGNNMVPPMVIKDFNFTSISDAV